MRLINTTNLTFEEFHDCRSSPRYAILSHCWGDVKDEVSYHAFRDATYNVGSYGWCKIAKCCQIASERGLDWAWIDTCCIDKSSSAELTEAINSMFTWYKHSSECYVFLPDVDSAWMPPEHLLLNRPTTSFDADVTDGTDPFLRSRWFTRGWTLQELLAPSSIFFFNDAFELIGTKQTLAGLITHTTGIDEAYLIDDRRSIKEASIATRMYWASSRTTTRVEDVAYSLLGISDVNMPLIYGEGDKAFSRLQSAIIQSSNDDSIFAWGCDIEQRSYSGVLAKSPRDFITSKDIGDDKRSFPTRDANFETTNRGIQYWYPMCSTGRFTPHHWLLSRKNDRPIRLRCKDESKNEHIALLLARVGNSWCRAGLKKYKPLVIEQHFHTLSAIFLPYRRVYITANLDNSVMAMKGGEYTATLPSATFYRLIVAGALSILAVALASSHTDPGVLLTIGVLQMAIDIAPSEVRTILPPTWILFGAFVDVYLSATKTYFPPS